MRYIIRSLANYYSIEFQEMQQKKAVSGMLAIPEGLRVLLERLEAAGYEAWCVGGCVRDALTTSLLHFTLCFHQGVENGFTHDFSFFCYYKKNLMRFFCFVLFCFVLFCFHVRT